MVHLKALPQSAQNRDRVLHRWLVHQHRLEPPLQRRILLQVFAVFIKRRRPDAMQLTAGQHRLQHVAGIHGTLRLPGADNRVQFVDEQQDAAVTLFDFLQHRLEALLELAAILRASQQRTHVEREDRLVLQPFRHIAAQDALCESLDDRGLAHAWFADQHRVVLGFPGQNADDAADLVVASDHRVELALARLLHEVDDVFLECLIRGLGVVGGHPLIAADLAQRLQHLRAVEAETLEILLECLRLGHVDEPEEQVLHADVLVLQLRGLVLGLREHLIDGLGDIDLRDVHAARHFRKPVELPLRRQLRTSAGLVLRLGDRRARHDGELAGIHGHDRRRLHANRPESEISCTGAPAVGHLGRKRATAAQGASPPCRIQIKSRDGSSTLAKHVVSRSQSGSGVPPLAQIKSRDGSSTLAKHAEPGSVSAQSYFATRTAASGRSTECSRISSAPPAEMRYSPSNAWGTNTRPAASDSNVPFVRHSWLINRFSRPYAGLGEPSFRNNPTGQPNHADRSA